MEILSEQNWSLKNRINKIITETKQIIGQDKAIIGLSGGVDSSTAAMLVSQAIGQNLIAIYIDTGLMRHKETDFVRKTFSKLNLNLKIIRARKLFFQRLKGIISPEAKRKIIGKLFIDLFEKQAKQVGLPNEIIHCQVFPGPGLGIRILGQITSNKVNIVRRASLIIEQELKKAELFQKQWMAFAVLLPIIFLKFPT